MCYVNGLSVRLVGPAVLAFGLFAATANAAPPVHTVRSLPAMPPARPAPTASFGSHNSFNSNPFLISPHATLSSPRLPFQFRQNQRALNTFLYGTPRPFSNQNFFNPGFNPALYGRFNPYLSGNFNPYFNPSNNPYAGTGFGNSFVNPYAFSGGGL